MSSTLATGDIESSIPDYDSFLEQTAAASKPARCKTCGWRGGLNQLRSAK